MFLCFFSREEKKKRRKRKKKILKKGKLYLIANLSKAEILQH